MFDEMPPEHFHQFIASSRHPSTLNFPPLDHHHHHQYPSNYNNNHLHSHQFLLHHNNKNINHKQLAHDHDHDDNHQRQLLSSGNNLEQDIIIRSADIDERSSDLWSNEEVLELLRIRSNMDQINWFPHHFTWNHVSRKLAELGFKKSPENCKERFEEESQHFSNNIANTKHYRFFSELEEICHGDQNPPVADEEDDDIIDNAQQQQEDRNIIQINLEKRKRSKKKKRFEKLKEFCEEIVNKMMSQQEHLNNKLIQDMLKRDEENVAKEEAWKSREIERINKDIESRAQERAISKERQDKIIEFINKFITSNSRNPNHEAAASSSSTGTLLEKDDSTGKRWPRDEVIALINLRSNHYRDEKAGLARGPLWERISKGMMELGYNRSGKRCKEKWENINKYYRKTKDGNKKRSVDSRTCPYFHQLSTLYNQTAFDHPENHSLSDNYHHDNVDDNGNVLHCDHDDKGETNLVG